MPNVAVVLKEEICRLARKEVKSQISPLKKALASERKTSAGLRRELNAQRKLLAQVVGVVKRQSKGLASVPAAGAAAGGDAPAGKWRKDTVRSTRRMLGVTQAQFAKLVGVSQITISFWETGRTNPRLKQQTSVLRVRALTKEQAHAQLGLNGESSGRRGRAKKA